MIGNDWERLGTIGMVGRYDLAQKSPAGEAPPGPLGLARGAIGPLRPA